MADRFYLNCPLAPGLVHLDGPEAHHLAAACRLRPGDLVCLFNGDGKEYPGRITHVERKHVEIEIQEVRTPDRELPFVIELAAPIPKGDRAQFLIEKLTELGVTTFIPLATQRSVILPRETKLEKLQRYVIEASKQCGRNRLMEIRPLADWKEYVAEGTLPHQRFLAHPGEAGKLPLLEKKGNLALAVGPEGGFTAEEIALARNNGWNLVDLGPRILRIETAALVLAGIASIPFRAHPAPGERET